MGTLYLVRHGQASFGADDYDQLSELGARQCHALGRWFAERGITFEAVLRGSLKRQAQSLSALMDGYGTALPEALVWPGLNEYDSHAVVQAVHPEPLPRADSADAYKHYFRVLRQGLRAWMAGTSAPQGMPSWREFEAGVSGALEHVRKQHGGQVLIVSSGGPIATAVGQVLGTDADTIVELNLRIRNSALTEFTFTPKRHMLLSYNHLPHLDTPERRGWESYS